MAKEHDASTGASNEHRVKGSEIFVGGLARTVTDGNIHEIFSDCGEIVELRMMKEQNGASKGFCFVRFATREAALKAQKEKNGIMVHGKKVGVSLSLDKDQLFFGNLRKEWSTEEFDELVHQAFEDVVSVDLAVPPSSEVSPAGKKRLNRGFGFVQFSSHAVSHNLVISCNFTPLDNSTSPISPVKSKRNLALSPIHLQFLKSPSLAFAGQLMIDS